MSGEPPVSTHRNIDIDDLRNGEIVFDASALIVQKQGLDAVLDDLSLKRNFHFDDKNNGLYNSFNGVKKTLYNNANSIGKSKYYWDKHRNKLADIAGNAQSSMKSTANELFNMGQQLETTYDKSKDADRHYKFVHDVVNEKHNQLKSNNYLLTDGLENNLRNIEISHYHYRRNRAQTQILKNIIYVCIGIWILNYCNKYFSVFMPDTLFVFLVGIILAMFFIYLMYSLYDIYSRDPRYYDEYAYEWSGSINQSKNKPNEKDVGEIEEEVYDFGLCQPST